MHKVVPAQGAGGKNSRLGGANRQFTMISYQSSQILVFPQKWFKFKGKQVIKIEKSHRISPNLQKYRRKFTSKFHQF